MRLIDADALDMAFTNLRFNRDMSLAHWGDRKDWCLHGHEVEKLIHNAPTIGGWISVKDRLPEEHKDVLLTGIEALNNERIYAVKVNDDGVWRPISAPSIIWDYWMPLPKPPKEDKLNAAD